MNPANKMHLKVMTPEKRVLSSEVDKVVAEAENGYFCLLPRHRDYLSGIVPGIFIYWIGEAEYPMAVNEGILVKKDKEVMVSVLDIIEGKNLEDLEDSVRKQFMKESKQEIELQYALKQLEADFIRRFIALEERMKFST